MIPGDFEGLRARKPLGLEAALQMVTKSSVLILK